VNRDPAPLKLGAFCVEKIIIAAFVAV